MWTYFTSFFKSQPEEGDLSLDEAYKILEEAEDEILPKSAVIEPDDSYSCYNKTGIITSMEDDICIIDDTYKFKTDLKNLKVGVGVTFTAFVTNGKVNVTNIAVQDEWCVPDVPEKSSWCHRNLICSVAKREGRNIYVTPGDLCIDLNTANIEFIPITGDWLEINAKVELNEDVTDLSGKVLEIEKIYPLRPQIIEGHIKKWDKIRKIGLINQNIFFNEMSLITGYIPKIGDKVVTEIIESDQRNCSYRSLKILPDALVHKKVQLVDERLPKFELTNDEVCISNDISLVGRVLCEEQSFIFTVTNQTQKDLELLSISVLLNNCDCVIKDPKYIVIAPSQNINIEGCCKFISVGKTRTLVLFSFANFKIGRWIIVDLQLNQNDYIKMDTSKNRTNIDLTMATTYFKNDNTFLVKGRKRYSTPNFVFRNMPPYDIPKILLKLVYKNYANNDHQLKAALQTNKPSLTEQVIFNNYEERFHTLLYLEEIETLIHMRRYDQKVASFIKNGEYLMLEIENLSERRPSLIVGDIVLAKDSYNQDAMEYEGIINEICARHIYVKFAQKFHDTYDGEDMSVIMIRSRSSFRKMHYAVGLAIRNLGPQILFPNKVEIKNPQTNFSETDFNNEDTDFNCKRLKLEWYNKNLNLQQKEAVRNVILGEAKPLPYIIFGPPGTGKTVTLVETILQLLRLIPHSRLLVATPSNSAANLIAFRLIHSGILKPGDLIRLVGHTYLLEDKLPLELIPYSAFVDIAISGSNRQPSTIYKNKLIMGHNSSIIGRHRITIGTCSVIGNLNLMSFPEGHFTHVIVDEAGQAIEPLIMLPLNMVDKSSGQIILAGDPLQLGPIIFSKLAIDYGLTETYLERIINRFPYIRDPNGFPNTNGYDPRLITKLVHNYRSLPDILALSSQLFYNNNLIPTICANDSDEAKLLDKIKEILPKRTDLKTPQVVFHGVIGDSYQSLDCPSWFNPNEVSQIFYYVNELYRLGLKSTDIGIISPYLKQAKQIRELLIEAEFDIPKVGSVEDFQGQEFNVILISTVRSNETTIDKEVRQQIGFISNPKRVNVAITRAQALMIIVGNPELLAQDSNWRYIIQYCIEHGVYCGCDLTNF